MADAYYLVALLVEHDGRDAEEEVFHVGNLLQEEAAHGIVHPEQVHFLVLAGQLGLHVVILEAHAVAGEHVEEFVLCHHAALPYSPDKLVGQHVVFAERYVGITLLAYLYLYERGSAVIIEDAARLYESAGRGGGLIVEHSAHGGEGDVYIVVILFHNLL